jgi:phosphoserine phosphatase
VRKPALAHRSRKEQSMQGNQAFVFDLDGTLVDSVYQHVLAWQEALDHAVTIVHALPVSPPP